MFSSKAGWRRGVPLDLALMKNMKLSKKNMIYSEIIFDKRLGSDSVGNERTGKGICYIAFETRTQHI